MATLQEIITPQNADGLATKTIRIFEANGVYRLEDCKLLWGVGYTKWFSSGVGAHYRYIQSTTYEFVYEGTDSGSIYLVQPYSKEQIQKNQEATGSEDIRQRIFKSKERFKSFFKLLNQQVLNGEIGKEEYMRIYRIISGISGNAYGRPLGYLARRLFGREIIREYLGRENLSETTRRIMQEILKKTTEEQK